jgi:hypothetical protein
LGFAFRQGFHTDEPNRSYAQRNLRDLRAVARTGKHINERFLAYIQEHSPIFLWWWCDSKEEK